MAEGASKASHLGGAAGISAILQSTCNSVTYDDASLKSIDVLLPHVADRAIAFLQSDSYFTKNAALSIFNSLICYHCKKIETYLPSIIAFSLHELINQDWMVRKEAVELLMQIGNLLSQISVQETTKLEVVRRLQEVRHDRVPLIRNLIPKVLHAWGYEPILKSPMSQRKSIQSLRPFSANSNRKSQPNSWDDSALSLAGKEEQNFIPQSPRNQPSRSSSARPAHSKQISTKETINRLDLESSKSSRLLQQDSEMPSKNFSQLEIEMKQTEDIVSKEFERIRLSESTRSSRRNSQSIPRNVAESRHQNLQPNFSSKKNVADEYVDALQHLEQDQTDDELQHGKSSPSVQTNSAIATSEYSLPSENLKQPEFFDSLKEDRFEAVSISTENDPTLSNQRSVLSTVNKLLPHKQLAQNSAERNDASQLSSERCATDLDNSASLMHLSRTNSTKKNEKFVNNVKPLPISLDSNKKSAPLPAALKNLPLMPNVGRPMNITAEIAKTKLIQQSSSQSSLRSTPRKPVEIDGVQVVLRQIMEQQHILCSAVEKMQKQFADNFEMLNNRVAMIEENLKQRKVEKFKMVDETLDADDDHYTYEGTEELKYESNEQMGYAFSQPTRDLRGSQTPSPSEAVEAIAINNHELWEAVKCFLKKGDAVSAVNLVANAGNALVLQNFLKRTSPEKILSRLDQALLLILASAIVDSLYELDDLTASLLWLRIILEEHDSIISDKLLESLHDALESIAPLILQETDDPLLLELQSLLEPVMDLVAKYSQNIIID